MESVLDKQQLRIEIRNNINLDKSQKIELLEMFHQGNIILALIEIREAIEECFARMDQTHIEASMMLVGCKETFDGYVSDRLKADKVLAGVVASILAKEPEKSEESDGPPAEENKNRVTLNHGDFGKIPSDSGIA